MRTAPFRIAPLLFAALGIPASSQVTYERLLKAAQEPGSWLTYSGDYSSRRYSSLDQINASNAVNLAVQWVFQSSTMYHSTTSGTCTSGGYYGGDCTADGNWDSGYQMSPAMYSHVFNTAGTFKYYCQAHTSSMTGSVVVLQ